MFAQGVGEGATLVAVDDNEYSADELKTAITAAAGRPQPIRLLIKERTRYRTVEINYRGGLRWPHLEKVAAGTALLDRLLSPLP